MSERMAPGTRFGTYTVEGLIAGGGMGQVYAARHDVYGTAVALKVLHEQLHADADWRARFNEEGLVGTQLKHPHVLSARELVHHDGRIALILDLVSGGQTLEKVMNREFPDGLPLLPALRVFLPIVQGIEYLHGKGIVHGDLKPENVMVQGELRAPETWTPKVTDFGTVGLVAHPVVIDGRVAVVATPRYASPEHLLGVDRIEVRSDVYSLGLILHYLLTGKHASSARNVREALDIVSAPINMANLVDQPEPLREVFVRATSVDPDGRYASCRELALAIRGVLDALGSPLELEDLQADLATEVDEERRKAAAAGDSEVSGAAALEPDDATEETDPGSGTPAPMPRATPAPVMRSTPAPVQRAEVAREEVSPPLGETILPEDADDEEDEPRTDPKAPTPAPPPRVTTDVAYPPFTAVDEQPVAARPLPAAPTFGSEEPAGSWWPWLAGIFLILGIVAAVVFAT